MDIRFSKTVKLTKLQGNSKANKYIAHLVPLWCGLLSYLLATQSPGSLEPSYSTPHQVEACCHHLGTHQSPCAESELHK